MLHVDAGKRLSLQVHDAKTESWLLMNGRAKVVWDDGSGELDRDRARSPASATPCQIGQRHRLVGITDCDILEVSTPEIGTTHRLEDDYARPDETEALRVERRRRGPRRDLTWPVSSRGVGRTPAANAARLWSGPVAGCHPVFRADSI